jgi:ligand-binding sensor domain-containing protein
MIRKGIIQICFLLSLAMATGAPIFAQAPFFKNIDFDVEKKGTKLNKIYQDSRGLMWLGTNWGLCRYDGINFKYLDKDSVAVSAIGESNDGVLWMGHADGEIEYVKNLSIQKYVPKDSMPKVKITSILFDKQNRLWFGTYGKGLYCYDHEVLYNINMQDGLTDDIVYDLFLAENNTVWAATDMGISVCRLTGGVKKISVINQNNGLPDNIVRSMKKDGAGNIWIALQDKGVCFYDKLTGKIKIPDEVKDWKYGQVNDILPLKREIFIGTEENGIIEIHFGLPALNKMIPVKRKKINFIQQLLLDNNEQVWVISDNTLSIANSNHFQIIEIPFEWQEPIKAITADSTGRIWFANRKGLFTKENNNTAIEKVTPAKDIDYSSIVCLYADYNNTIWIGTYNNGLYHYYPKSGLLEQYTKAKGLVDDNVFSICGAGSEIWLGTLGGATKMDIYSGKPLFRNFTRENGLSNNYVYNVSIDSKNNKWFATDGSGITRLSESGFEHYYPIAGLEKNIAYTTTQDIYGNIWFTGLNSGLFVFDGKKFGRYTIKDGLHDNEILNVVADNKGNLLLAHPDGLELFNIRKELFTFYGPESGFENIRPQLNAYCKTPRNAILIGATEKIIQYYPADSRYTQLPQLEMNDVMIFFKSIGLKDNPTLQYNENHLTFDYAGLWYINPNAVNYQYLLQGYSKGWINTKDHIITFPNLPPGKYSLHVKTSINDDYRYSPELVYNFTILKPFWKTAWFILLALIASGLLVYYFVRLRIRVIRYEQEKDKQKYITQLAVLKNQLNPHFLFNSFNTLMNIIDKDKGMAIEYAEKLSDFYREILMLQDKEMIFVKEEVNLLENYVYLQRKRFGDNLRLRLNISEKHLQSGIPPLTLQLLVENALKHNMITDDKPLSVTIESAQSFLIVSNNINKLDKEIKTKSAGIGLQNIQQRVQLLTGREVKIVQTENEFNVIIPLKQ